MKTKMLNIISKVCPGRGTAINEKRTVFKKSYGNIPSTNP